MTTETSTKAMSLVDGHLDPAELPDLVQKLARDTRLLAEAQSFLAMSRARVAEPYRGRASEPVPAWLVDTVMHASVATTGGPPIKPLAYVRELLGRLGEHRAPAWALAAGPALAAAAVALGAWLLFPMASQSQAMMTAQLHNALEKAPSGKDVPMLAFSPTLTYWSKDHMWCRQFEVRSGGTRQAVAAVACRSNNGSWRVVREASPTPMGTVPAASSREQIDRFVTGDMAGAPLERAQVDAKIEQGWLPLK